MSQNDNSDDASPEIEPEFSRPVDVTSFGAKGRHFKFYATEEERCILARRYSVMSVDRLDAECKITPTKRGHFSLEATFSACIWQACGISLEPVEDKISGKFKIVLKQPLQQKRKESPEIDFNPDEDDTEILESNLIDVGEMIAQHLSLEINPYPRRQNATGNELGHNIVGEEDLILEEQKKNPFAVLKSLEHKT